MRATEFSCPACGAPQSVANPGVVMVVCEYCGNAITWDEEALRNVGKQATLREGFSRLYRGATGKMGEKRFSVLGRVRYSFGRGFWDEWFLEFRGGKTAWLSEDDHELALETEAKNAGVGAFESYRPGMLFAVKGSSFVVEEVGEAECLGMEGDLPELFETGEKYPYVDASSPDGRHTLAIEYDSGDSPTVFRGRWLKHAALKLDDEGKKW